VAELVAEFLEHLTFDAGFVPELPTGILLAVALFGLILALGFVFIPGLEVAAVLGVTGTEVLGVTGPTDDLGVTREKSLGVVTGNTLGVMVRGVIFVGVVRRDNPVSILAVIFGGTPGG